MKFLKAGLFGFIFFSLTSAQVKFIKLDRYQDFIKGEFKSSVVSSEGKIYSGKSFHKIKVDADAIWSILEIENNKLLLGTGNKAKLFEVSKGKVKEIFQAQNRLAITDMVKDKSGKVYFAVIPNAIIYQIYKGKIKEIAEPDVEYIWKLKVLKNGKILAGGGGKAKIFLIDPVKKTCKKLLELNAQQITDIVSDSQGKLYAGTSRPAYFVEFSLDGSYRIIYSFSEEEVKAIVPLSGGDFLIAVNQGIALAPPSPQPAPAGPAEGETQGGEEQSKPVIVAPQASRARGSGVYLLNLKKGIDKIFNLTKATIIAVCSNKEGIFLGSDADGRVYQVVPQTREYRLVFDFEAVKITAFAFKNKRLRWLATSQPTELIQIKSSATTSSYTSDVLDTGFVSRWGRISWKGYGLVRFKTRSGNTSKPDESWSDWKEVGAGGRIKSPQARFLQISANWLGKEDVAIDWIEISYKNLNQAHFIEELKVQPTRPASSRPRKPSGNRSSSSPLANKMRISWKINNPDRDQLEYSLFYRKLGDRLWILLAEGEEIRGTNFQWDTSGIEDGWYQIRLVASDAPSNPEDESYKVEKISEAFIIDHTKPEIKFTISSAGLVQGKAKDKTSRIASLEYSLDGEDYKIISSKDKILDQKDEQFEFSLFKIKPGWHQISIRACDQAQNCAIVSKEFKKK